MLQRQNMHVQIIKCGSCGGCLKQRLLILVTCMRTCPPAELPCTWACDFVSSLQQAGAVISHLDCKASRSVQHEARKRAIRQLTRPLDREWGLGNHLRARNRAASHSRASIMGRALLASRLLGAGAGVTAWAIILVSAAAPGAIASIARLMQRM